MSELLKILAVALITVFANMIIKQTKPEIAILISIAGSVLIIVMANLQIKQELQEYLK